MRDRFFRSYEFVIIAYFLYTSVLAVVLPLNSPVPAVTLGLNALALFGLVFLAYADSFRRGEFLGIVRDWYTPPLLLLAYREMGWFAQPHTSTALEDAWVVWDRVLLNEWGLKAAIEVLGPVIPSVLELSYTMVYAMAPIGLVVLYVVRRRSVVEPFLFNFTLAVLAVYALFPYFPSEPPWTVFPGEDYPSYDTVFRWFNAGMLKGQGIHTSVFPSAHVSGSMSVALALIRLLPGKKLAGRIALFVAVCIALATVYGRYHYSADALAGLAVCLGATAVSVYLERTGKSSGSSR